MLKKVIAIYLYIKSSDDHCNIEIINTQSVSIAETSKVSDDQEIFISIEVTFTIFIKVLNEYAFSYLDGTTHLCLS